MYTKDSIRIKGVVIIVVDNKILYVKLSKPIRVYSLHSQYIPAAIETIILHSTHWYLNQWSQY